MKNILAAAALAASAFAATAALATPLPVAAPAQSAPAIEQAQYRTTVTTRRVVRPAHRARRCVIRTERMRTPRGVVVRKVRTCR